MLHSSSGARGFRTNPLYVRSLAGDAKRIESSKARKKTDVKYKLTNTDAIIVASIFAKVRAEHLKPRIAVAFSSYRKKKQEDNNKARPESRGYVIRPEIIINRESRDRQPSSVRGLE